jgi:hypothetical protein
MFDLTKITTALTGLVGWDDSTNPSYAIVTAANKLSSSGRKYTDNPLVKIEYLKDTQDYQAISDANFNTFLTGINNKAITTVVDSVMKEPDFIDRQLLYQYTNNKKNTETLINGFVGYRIKQCLEKNICIEISRCILEFEGTGTIKLLLFNTAKKTALYTKEVTITSSLQEVELNWKMDNTSAFYKGDYYFGYLTKDVSIQPIKRNYENANIKSVITYLDIWNIQAPNIETEELWDLEINEGSSDCFGLNMDISVYYDYTDSIIRNKNIFAKAIQLQGQILCLSQYLATLRSNINERLSKEMINKIVIEIEGADIEDGLKKVGLRRELAGEVNRLQKEVMRLYEGFYSVGITVETLC